MKFTLDVFLSISSGPDVTKSSHSKMSYFKEKSSFFRYTIWAVTCNEQEKESSNSFTIPENKMKI